MFSVTINQLHYGGGREMKQLQCGSTLRNGELHQMNLVAAQQFFKILSFVPLGRSSEEHNEICESLGW